MADTLLNLYGAKRSKSGNHLNITLTTGEHGKRNWFTCPIKMALDAKIHAEIQGNCAVIYVPLLKDEKQEEIKDEDLPF